MSNDWFKQPIDLANATVSWMHYSRMYEVRHERLNEFWTKIDKVIANIVDKDGRHRCGLQLKDGLILYYERKQDDIYIEPVYSVSGLDFDYHEVPSEYWELREFM
jgi:hypothetical protein